MKISAEDYREAGRQRIETARRLHDAGFHSEAVYLAGVAVECMLRAYITGAGGEPDARHDLNLLFNRSEMKPLTASENVREINTSLANVWMRWDNLYRYVSDGRLRSEYKRLKLYKGIRGDVLKRNAQIVIESATRILKLGESLWEPSKKK